MDVVSANGMNELCRCFDFFIDVSLIKLRLNIDFFMNVSAMVWLMYRLHSYSLMATVYFILIINYSWLNIIHYFILIFQNKCCPTLALSSPIPLNIAGAARVASARCMRGRRGWMHSVSDSACHWLLHSFSSPAVGKDSYNTPRNIYPVHILSNLKGTISSAWMC